MKERKKKTKHGTHSLERIGGGPRIEICIASGVFCVSPPPFVLGKGGGRTMISWMGRVTLLRCAFWYHKKISSCQYAGASP